MTKPRLQGRVALVTGASSGIGEATAAALAREGAAVAVGARRADRLDALVQRIEADGGRALALDLDVTDEAQCQSAVDRTVGELGRLDILINNAGVMLLGPVEGADTEDWRRMMSTNVLGALYMTHAALPHLLANRGDLVQMSSVAGRTAQAGAAVYNASKWGLNAFSESLRQEVTGRGVRVVVVEPGVVATELMDHITHEGTKEMARGMAQQMRQLQPDDVAAAVVYAVTQPAHIAVNEVLVRPTDQQG